MSKVHLNRRIVKHYCNIVSVNLMINACQKCWKMKTSSDFLIRVMVLIRVDKLLYTAFLSKCAVSKFEIPDKSLALNPNQSHFRISLTQIHIVVTTCIVVMLIKYYRLSLESMISLKWHEIQE